MELYVAVQGCVSVFLNEFVHILGLDRSQSQDMLPTQKNTVQRLPPSERVGSYNGVVVFVITSNLLRSGLHARSVIKRISSLDQTRKARREFFSKTEYILMNRVSPATGGALAISGMSVCQISPATTFLFRPD